MRITSKYGKPTQIKLEKSEERTLERAVQLCSQISRQNDASPLGKSAMAAFGAISHVQVLLAPAEQPEPVTTGNTK